MRADGTADVLIVGAGPVGLTLAIDLGQRGLEVVVVETRTYGEPPSVKCNHVAARTMEQFRRLGVAKRLRAAGLPPEWPNDVVFRTAMTGTELARIAIPCRRDRYTDRSGPDGWWPTPEPPHRINQIFLEPILLDHAARQPGVTLVHRAEVEGFAQDADGVAVEVLDLESGDMRTLRAAYLVGCDGGASGVRKAIGVRLEGDAVIQRVQSTYLRAPSLAGLLPGKPAWCYYAVNPRRTGTVFAIDGRETWLVHNHLRSDEPDFESVDRDRSIRAILGVDEHFDYEILSKEDWVGRRLVAPRFRDGRVFLAGDAAHLWVPYAGYGMNAGIADALALGWLLAARLEGWGGAAMLDAYEAERQPITAQVSRFAMSHAQKMIAARGAVPADIEAGDAAGAEARARAGREAYALNVQQFCCAGLNFGYYYDGSPIIAYDDEAPPPYTMGEFTASTVPGCRAPHAWLADGRSLYDALGPGYTLLVRDARVDTEPLRFAARTAGMPLAVVVLDDAVTLPPEYRHALIVCRRDQHIAWRGDRLPESCVALVARLCGAVPTESRHDA